MQSYSYTGVSFADFMIKFKKSEYFVHKAIVCVNSQYFYNLILDYDEDSHTEHERKNFADLQCTYDLPVEIVEKLQFYKINEKHLHYFFTVMYQKVWPSMKESVENLIALARLSVIFDVQFIRGQLLFMIRELLELKKSGWAILAIASILENKEFITKASTFLATLTDRNLIDKTQLYEEFIDYCSLQSFKCLLETRARKESKSEETPVAVPYEEIPVQCADECNVADDSTFTEEKKLQRKRKSNPCVGLNKNKILESDLDDF